MHAPYPRKCLTAPCTFGQIPLCPSMSSLVLNGCNWKVIPVASLHGFPFQGSLQPSFSANACVSCPTEGKMPIFRGHNGQRERNSVHAQASLPSDLGFQNQKEEGEACPRSLPATQIHLRQLEGKPGEGKGCSSEPSGVAAQSGCFPLCHWATLSSWNTTDTKCNDSSCKRRDDHPPPIVRNAVVPFPSFPDTQDTTGRA